LLKSIAGLIRWEQEILRGTRQADIHFDGSIKFNGENIKGLPAHGIAKRGLTLAPERSRPLRELSVLDNLKAGGYLCHNKEEIKESLEAVFQLFPKLKERGNQVSGTLSGGERQMLGIGRALMYRPKLMLVDEPSTGLSPGIKEELFDKVAEIYKMGTTILLAEQDISFAFELASRNYVLSRGHVVTEGSAEKLLADETIRKTYLGL
jgi:branched-chain amino acid transport system ATP-binding protein